MAGLYITWGEGRHTRLDGVADSMRYGGEAERSFQSMFSYIWLSHDDEERYAPAVDPETGVQCIVAGRLCWPAQSWTYAGRMQYQGGIANRLLLDRYLTNGANAVLPFNGAAVVVIWDPRNQRIHVWSDQFGYHPVFVYCDADKAALSLTTFPDAILADKGLKVEYDLVSMAEFLRAWRITPPYTYYKKLRHIGPATHLQIELPEGKVKSDEYWRPFEDGFYSTLEEGAESLATALKEGISERTAAANKSVFFVSGGADSRVMLYGAEDPSKVWGVNLYETPTEESEVARELCNRAGVKYIGFGRDGDYYPRMQAENVRWSGAMWSMEDNHYLGAHEVVNEIGADLVMTACTTDWIFKGYGLEKIHRRFLGKNLPFYRFTNQRVDGFLPNYPLPPPNEFADEINERLESWFEGVPRQLNSDHDRVLAEDRRIRPACYTVSVSGQIMYRTYPYDTFLADSRVAACYARTPAKWKLNGQLWGMAAGMLCQDASDIIDANYGWAVDAGMGLRLYAFSKGWIKRRISKREGYVGLEGHPPSYASWPELGWYARHSDRLKTFWAEVPSDHKALLTHTWGSDPWQHSLEYWSSRPNDLMRMLTLLQHWQINGLRHTENFACHA